MTEESSANAESELSGAPALESGIRAGQAIIREAPAAFASVAEEAAVR